MTVTMRTTIGIGMARNGVNHSDVESVAIRARRCCGMKVFADSKRLFVRFDDVSERDDLEGWLTKILLGTLLSLASSSNTLDRDFPLRSTKTVPFVLRGTLILSSILPYPIVPLEPAVPFTTTGRAVRSLDFELVELERDRPFGFGEGEEDGCVGEGAGGVEERDGRKPELAGDEGPERDLACSDRR